MTGKRILHYEVVRQLGAGGMGEVYEAFDTRLRRPVALKMLRSQPPAASFSRERFLIEARAASALDHPNICGIYAIEETEGGDLVLAMALYRGQTLDGLLRAGPFPLSQITSVAVQVARALNAAHTAGIVHRDIKPSNLLLTEDRTIKVLDFGLSSVAADEGATRLTAPQQVMGTLPYMSPEQLRGSMVDHRTDLWALGAVIYEMATGATPFHRLRETAIMHAIASEPYRPPREMRPDLPASLETVIRRALEKNVLDRYASATAMIADLQETVRSESAQRPAVLPPAPTISRPAPARSTAIAVLPLQNLSSDPENEYFSDGLTEEFISMLGHVKRLRVVSRSSVFAFKGKAQDVRKVGEALGVDVVLEGSVRRSGARVRTSLQLTSVADGYQLWSERYDRELVDIFALQDEMAQTVVNALQQTLDSELTPARVTQMTHDVEAYELYLKGRYYWNQKTPQSTALALQHFELALEKDPNFALGHSGVADVYALLASLWVMPAQTAWPLARAAAQRAIALDRRLAAPHISLGYVLQFYEWNWEAANREMTDALLLQPQIGDSYVSYAYHLMTQGQLAAALAQLRIGLHYDPLSLPLRTTEAMVRTYLGEHDAAIALALGALESAPHFLELYYVLGIAYMGAGRAESARQILERGANASGRFPLLLGWLGAAHVQAGDTVAAEAVLDELLAKARESFAVPLPLAVLYTALGRKDEAFTWLDKAAEARDTILCYLPVLPTFAPLHGDPRYQAILRRMGLSFSEEAAFAGKQPNAETLIMRGAD